MTDIDVLEGEVLDEWTPQQAATYVSEPWQNAVGSIVETGRRIHEARTRVPRGQWGAAVALMPFGERTAQKLMQIARHPDLADPKHVTGLPASWGTLAILAQLPPGEIPKRIEAGEITPELDRSTAQGWVSVYAAARQESLNAWNQMCDALTIVLSHVKTYRPPSDTDNYRSVKEVVAIFDELVTIAATWEESR